MNSDKPIGGYFGLEIIDKGSHIYDDGILLNSARNCLEYILRTQQIKKIFVPSYTCDVIYEPLKKLQVVYETYEVNSHLEIADNITLEEEEWLLYTNYFGFKDAYCDELLKHYGDKLVLDCSQAFFYSPKTAEHRFYSPRKFVGLADGGILYTTKTLSEGEDLPQGFSVDRAKHLFTRIDKGAEAGYKEFLENDSSLSDMPIMRMSQLTESMLRNIDFPAVVMARGKNYDYLADHLEVPDFAPNSADDVACPMVFIYRSNREDMKRKLIENKIYVATYWPNVLEVCAHDSLSYALARDLIPLPIDQRYNESDMQRIVEVINANKN